jgi:hypothetical protein
MKGADMNPTTSLTPYLVSVVIAVLSAAAMPDAAVTHAPEANAVRHADVIVGGKITPPPATRPAS